MPFDPLPPCMPLLPYRLEWLHNPAGAIVKKEPKWSESPAHLKEPQSPEVKHKVKPEQWPEGEYDKVVLAEKMELQQAYKNVCDQHEELQLAYKELKEKMEHISGSQSESSEDTKAMGKM